jgi:hypothetical protein
MRKLLMIKEKTFNISISHEIDEMKKNITVNGKTEKSLFYYRYS